MSERIFNLIATSAFGLEGMISAELKRLNMKNVIAANGFVRFSGSIMDAYYCNLRSRFADRIMILLAESPVISFDELFRLVDQIKWELLMDGTEKINISCKCARSKLMSQSACQSIAKKAVIEHIKKTTNRKVFPESGFALPVHISIHQDTARIMLDTTGEGLSRRGYRTWNGEAPLRETLAAALVESSPWRPGIPLYDPCCGSGTLIIEASLRASHKAPGSNREFALEHFVFFPKEQAKKLLKQVQDEFEPERIKLIRGSDIDPSAIDLSRKHIRQAGLEGYTTVDVIPLQELQLSEEKGVFLCNPPYGERLGDRESCRKLYADLHLLQLRHPGWSLCAITSDPGFERAFGRKADRKRRFYNGTLECEFYTFLP